MTIIEGAESNATPPAGRDGRERADEVPEFFGPFSEGLFGCAYIPQGVPFGGVVICPSIHAELLANYRREVLLARTLAKARFAVQRFHYRGTGQSDGEGREVTYGRMVEDVLAAAAHLVDRIGVSSVAFVGTRWGALVGASAAANWGDGPLVMWEPVVDAERFFREVVRLRIIAEMKDGTVQASGDELLGRIEMEERLDVLGNAIDRALFATSAGRTLSTELGNDPRPMLLLQLSPSTRMSPAYATLLDQWRAAGFDVQSDVLVDEAAWWFPDQPPRGTNALIGRTARWIERTAPTGGTR